MIRPYRQLAFTLVEILVALTIIVAIVSMVHGSYLAASGSAQACTRKTTALQAGHLALHQIAAQIRCAVAPDHTRSSILEGQGDSPLPADRDVAKIRARPPLFAGSNRTHGDILQFVTTKPLPSEPAQDPMRRTSKITFNRETGQLILSQWPYRETTRPEPRECTRLVLAEHVTEITLTYYDGSKWQNRWDSRECRALPRAVGCELTLQDDQDKGYTTHVIVPILCRISPTHAGTKEMPR